MRGEWFQLPVRQLSGNQKKFPGRKIDIGADKLTCKTANDCELAQRRDIAWRIEIPSLDFKQFMPDKQFAIWLDQFWPHVIEVDALRRLFNMQPPWIAFVIYAVPVEHAISRVAILLDLD